MSGKHTPGPWEVVPTGHRIRSCEREVDGRFVARQDVATLPGVDGRHAGDAKLIAAAPDMAEALAASLNCTECGEDYGVCVNCLKRMRAALIKAGVL